MPSITKPIDATKYEIRALWTGVGVGHMSEDVEVVTVGYPFEPPDDLGGWYLVDYTADKDNTDRFFTLWAREKIKPKAAKKKKKPGAPAADIQNIIDETKAAVAPQPAPKKKRGRPPRVTSGAPATPSENGAAEPSNGPPPVAHLPLYEGK